MVAFTANWKSSWLFYLFIILGSITACEKESILPADASFPEITQNFSAFTRLLLENHNLDYPGLESAKAAFMSGDNDQAIEALYEHYKLNPAGEIWREAEVTPININDPILNYLRDIFTFQGVKAKVPRHKNGYLDWKFTPPGASQEFTHYLNRFTGLSHWVRAAKQTESEIWINFLNETLSDWIISNPYRTDRLPEPVQAECRSYEFGGSNNYPWLILNAGVRLRAFQKAFYQMMRHDLMQPKTFLLLLASIEAHSDYLYTRGGFNGDNWDNITLDALLKVSTGFPEFNRSMQFKEAAAERYLTNLQKVWYDDGSQWELAGHYGALVLNNSIKFFEQLTNAGVTVPAQMLDLQKKQLWYIACTADPNGYILPANDSDPNEKVAENILDFARNKNELEALYLITQGNEGIPGTLPSSRFFEYAGNLISRDAWSDTRHWSCFDMGPFGMGHNHADKLSLTIYNGRKILVDPGRFTYGSNNAWATYRQATRAHNTIIIDGSNQKMISNNGGKDLPGAIDEYLKNNPRSFLQKYDMARDVPIPSTEYEISEDHDFARGRVTAGYEGQNFSGQAIHERSIWYQRGAFWLVVDRVFSDRDREIEVFWHFHPNCKSVEIMHETVLTNDPGVGNIIIIPVQGSAPLHLHLVKGQEQPHVQGWYSPEFNQWIQSYDAIYSGKVGKNNLMGWLIIPFAGNNPQNATAQIIHQEDNLITVMIDIAEYGQQIIRMPLENPPVL